VAAQPGTDLDSKAKSFVVSNNLYLRNGLDLIRTALYRRLLWARRFSASLLQRKLPPWYLMSPLTALASSPVKWTSFFPNRHIYSPTGSVACTREGQCVCLLSSASCRGLSDSDINDRFPSMVVTFLNERRHRSGKGGRWEIQDGHD
jgi:hypothetical protein